MSACRPPPQASKRSTKLCLISAHLGARNVGDVQRVTHKFGRRRSLLLLLQPCQRRVQRKGPVVGADGRWPATTCMGYLCIDKACSCAGWHTNRLDKTTSFLTGYHGYAGSRGLSGCARGRGRSARAAPNVAPAMAAGADRCRSVGPRARSRVYLLGCMPGSGAASCNRIE